MDGAFSLRLHFKDIRPIVKMSSVSFLFFLPASFSASLPFVVCAGFFGPATEKEKSVGFISSLKNEVGPSWRGDEVTKSHLSFSMRHNELLETGL